jgi:hypothetical protein
MSGIRGVTALGALRACLGSRSLLSLGTAMMDALAERISRMPGPGEPRSQQPARIIGREAGLAQLRGLVDQVQLASQVLLVTGAAGMGKTVLLAAAADRARSAGLRVLSVTGRESESNLAFAGLHQLLRPVLSSAAGLPGRQTQALTAALGLAAEPVAPDPLLTGVAVLTLLSDLSERSPVLVVADDAQWLDRSSLEALAFAGSRLDAERVVLLVGARGSAPPPGFDRGFPELHLEPLSAADAGRLLDGQPRPPRGRARAQVLAQAAGNPMALIELAKVIADDPAASRHWAAEPLPLTDRLSAVLTARYATLPEQTQAALRLAAVADGPDLRVAASHGAGPDAQALAPAEQLGLVTVDRTGLQFSHPLVRSAIYHATPFAQRAAGSPRPCTTSQTGVPGTWPPRPCNRTSRWLRCWRPPPPRRNTAAAPPLPRWRWSARPNSAPTAQTRHAGWSPPLRPPFPPARGTGCRISPPAPWRSRLTRNCG